MPRPPHVLIGTERARRGFFPGNRLTRWLNRPTRNRHETAVAASAASTATAPQPDASQVDVETRAFWAGSETATVTSRRAAALVDAHERGRGPAGARPPGNPAFSEALFVELTRATQQPRAPGPPRRPPPRGGRNPPVPGRPAIPYSVRPCSPS